MTANTGRCLCGAVRYTGKGERGAIHVCHCTDCRRWAGGPAMAVAFADGIDIVGEVRWYKSSDWAERGSCPACGAALFYRLQDGSYLNASAGSLDDQTRLGVIHEHIFADSRPDYYDFADKAPRVTGKDFFARFQSTPAGEP